MGRKILLPACLACLCAWLSPDFTRAGDKRVVLAIIVNPASGLSDISTADLAKIFKAQKTRSAEGVRYLVAGCAPGTPEREAALRSIYKMSEGEYERYFLQGTFAGTIQSAPKVLPDGAAVRHFVASAPGAIGYVFAGQTDATVKVLTVDGRPPGDAGYPLSPQDPPSDPPAR